MSRRPARDEMDGAVERLRSGGAVAFPTETVYGLGADATDAGAIAGVFRLKGRPATNPLIVHVASDEMVRAFFPGWPDRAEPFAAAFWPGPLTLVVPRPASIPEIATGGGPTVGVRRPDHPVALELIERFGRPIVGPSANPSGRLSPTRAEHVRSSFRADEVLTLDAGPCPGGVESTVLDVGADPARILRPGPLGVAELSRVGAVEGGAPGGAAPTRDGPDPSPGLAPSHYAPRARVELVGAGDVEGAVNAVPGRVAALLVRAPGPARASVTRLPEDAPSYGAAMYAALRDADDAGAELIVVERPEGAGALWDAVRDRLTRAAAPRP